MRAIATALIWIALIVWAALVAKGFLAYMSLEATGSGFTRGSNRIGAFLQWQGLALAAAFVGTISGRVASATGVTRFASRIPFWLSGGFFVVLVLGFLALLVWSWVAG